MSNETRTTLVFLCFPAFSVCFLRSFGFPFSPPSHPNPHHTLQGRLPLGLGRGGGSRDKHHAWLPIPLCVVPGVPQTGQTGAGGRICASSSIGQEVPRTLIGHSGDHLTQGLLNIVCLKTEFVPHTVFEHGIC